MAMMESDVLIKELIQTNHLASEVQLDQIVRHVAQRPVSIRLIKINQWLRHELRARGVQASLDRLPSAELHLLKRIYFDGQWPATTTVKQFEEDLHRAIRHPQAQVWTYRRFGEHCAGFMAPSHIQAFEHLMQHR
jgi:hypothetical protein